MIVLGTTRKRRQLGHVAEFCAICRDFRPVTVTRLSEVAHLYYIPLGRGRTVLHELKCRTCGTVTAAERASYAGFVKEPPADIADLAEATNPDIMETYESRLNLEDRLEKGRVTRAERLSLIAEPLTALEFMVKQKASGSIPTAAGVAIIAALALGTCAAVAWGSGRGAQSVAVTFSVLTACAAGVAVVSFRNGHGRWIRRWAIPRVVQALRSIRPSREELAEVFAGLRAARLTVGRRLRPDEVWNALEADRARAG